MNKEYIVHNTNEDLESLKLQGVYLIRNLDNNMLKIGVASNLSRRFKQLISTFKHVGQKPNLKIECFIECEDTYSLESYLHKKFKEHKYQNEWFDIQDINDILKILDMYDGKEVNEMEEQLNNIYEKGLVFLTAKDREPLIEIIGLIDKHNSKIKKGNFVYVKNINSLNGYLEEVNSEFRIKKFKTSRTINRERKQYSQAWKLIK